MKRELISEFIDSVLLFAVTMIFGCAVVGYFSRSTAVIVTAALACAFCVTAFVRFLKSRRKRDIDKAEYDDVWLQFFARGDAFCLDTVSAALSNRYNTERRDGYIVCNHSAVYLHFKPEPLSLNRLFEWYANTLQNTEIQKIIIMTAVGTAPAADKTASQLTEPTVSIINGEDVFRLLRSLDALPERKIRLKKGESGLKTFLLQAVSPKTAKRYLLTALFLIGSSFLFPMPIYYIVGGAICLVLAVAASAKGFQRKRAEKKQH